MNSCSYFDYIHEKLCVLSFRIKSLGKINLLNLNIHSEKFFAELFNGLFGVQLENANALKQNMESFDLLDKENKIIAQVSATCTKQKIEDSLKKEILRKYSDFRFVFIAISGEADKLKKTQFNNPYAVLFDPSNDIFDIQDIFKMVMNMNVTKQREMYELVKAELGNQVDVVKMDSNLASIINILSKEDLSVTYEFPEINSFEILRKIEYNGLITVSPTIEEYKVFGSRLNEIYKEFDKLGANKSLSVLNVIRGQYVKLLKEIKDPHDLFFAIIDGVIDIIINSKNYLEIPYEELEMSVSILVVDAFIRCKIFKNPEGYNYVAAR